MRLVRQWLVAGLVAGNKLQKGDSMFLILAIVFLLIWAFGSLVFHAVGGMIHLLLAVALVSALLHFVRRPGGRAGV
jgi:hypothetical protein